MIIAVTKQVMIKSEELIEQLNDIVSKGVLVNDYEKENFLFGRYVMNSLLHIFSHFPVFSNIFTLI